MALCNHCGHALDAHIQANRGRAAGVLNSANPHKGYRYALCSCPWYRVIDPVRMRYYVCLERAAEARRHFAGMA